MVRLDCPPISFFFVRLSSLLELWVDNAPRLGFSWVEIILLGLSCVSFFPLVHHFVWFTQPLIMFGEGEVRSSELEIGLSSSKDRKALKVTSPLTPYKAWDVCYVLKMKDEGRIRSRFQFPSSVRVRIPNDDDKACRSYVDKVCFYKANFISGLHFPIHPFLRKLFSRLSFAPAQLVPNSWRIVIFCLVV